MISTDTTTKLTHNAMPVRYQLSRRSEATLNTVQLENNGQEDGPIAAERSTINAWKIEKDPQSGALSVTTSGTANEGRIKHVTFADTLNQSTGDSVGNEEKTMLTTFPCRQSSYVQHLKCQTMMNDNRSRIDKAHINHKRPTYSTNVQKKHSGSIPIVKETQSFAQDSLADGTPSELATLCDFEGQMDKDDIVLSYRRLTRSLNDLQKPPMIPGILPVIPPRKSSGKSNIPNPEAERLRSRSPYIGTPILKYSNRPNSVASVVSSDDLDRSVNAAMPGKTDRQTSSMSSNFRGQRSRSQPTPEPSFIEVDDTEITGYQMKIMTHLANQYRYRYVPRVPTGNKNPSSAPALRPPRQLSKQYLSKKDTPKEGNTCTFSQTDVHKIILERIKTLTRPKVILKDTTPKKHKGKIILGSPKKYAMRKRLEEESETKLKVAKKDAVSNEFFKFTTPIKQQRYLYTL